MKYLAEDGKVFEDECECMRHERKLDDVKKKQEELESMADVILDSIKEFCKKYEEVYGKEDEYQSGVDTFIHFIHI